MRRAGARVGATAEWTRGRVAAWSAAAVVGAGVIAASAVGCRPAFRVHDDDAGAGEGGALSATTGSPARDAAPESLDGSHRADAAPTAAAPAAPASGPMGVTFPDGVGRELAQLEPAFRACYARGLAHDGNQEGSPIVTIAVDQAGRVTSSRITDDGLRDDVVACLMAKIRASSFDPVIGDGRTLRFQVTFRPPR